MSVIQRNSKSAPGTTLMRKSGFQCFVISARLIRRTRSSSLRSRNGMNSAGANVNLRFDFFIGGVSGEPGSGGLKVFFPKHKVRVRARLDAAFLPEAEQPGGVERAHGPHLLWRQRQPALQVGNPAIHREG